MPILSGQGALYIDNRFVIAVSYTLVASESDLFEGRTLLGSIQYRRNPPVETTTKPYILHTSGGCRLPISLFPVEWAGNGPDLRYQQMIRPSNDRWFEILFSEK
jgi:hypothetical protein